MQKLHHFLCSHNQLLYTKFIENKDSENRENLPKDYYSDVGVHPYKMFKDFCCIPTRESTGDRVFHNLPIREF
jgi:hypothetical protein